MEVYSFFSSILFLIHAKRGAIENQGESSFFHHNSLQWFPKMLPPSKLCLISFWVGFKEKMLPPWTWGSYGKMLCSIHERGLLGEIRPGVKPYRISNEASFDPPFSTSSPVSVGKKPNSFNHLLVKGFTLIDVIFPITPLTWISVKVVLNIDFSALGD